MEKINWLFNADFEENLFSGNFDSLKSNKQNQEFEYFINFLNPDDCLYSLKKYDSSYLDFFKQMTGKDFLLSSKSNKTQLWCQNYGEADLLKKWQSKLKSLLHFKQLGLIKHHLEIIDSVSSLSEGFLYKDPFELSGRGHYQYPKDKEKLIKLLGKREIIKEEILDRKKDFSALISNNSILCIYENFVDDYFQYKGTLIGADLDKEFQQDYLDALSIIMKNLAAYQGIYSIDSFLYKQKNQILLQPITEINMRKTMGYIAFHLKKQYFSHQKYFQLKLIKNTKEIDHQQVWDKYGKDVCVISPNSNLFHVYLIAGNTIDMISEREEELLATFF